MMATQRLRRGEVAKIPSGATVQCCAGVVQAGGRVLVAGDVFAGPVSVTALEGWRDEWHGDSGIAVLFVCDEG